MATFPVRADASQPQQSDAINQVEATVEGLAVDLGPLETIARKYQISDGGLWVSPDGSDDNDGLSGGSARLVSQETIDSLPATGGKINVLQGRHEFVGPLVIPGDKGVWVEGQGWGTGAHNDGAELVNTGVLGQNAIELGDGSAQQTTDLNLTNFKIIGNPLSGIGIWNRRVNHAFVYRVRSMEHGLDGFQWDRGYASILRDVYGSNNGRDGWRGGESNDFVRIEGNSTFLANGEVGIHGINGASPGFYVRADMEGNDRGFVWETSTVDTGDGGVGLLHLDNCYFEEQIGKSIEIGGGSGFPLAVLLLTGIQFGPTGAGSVSTNEVLLDKVVTALIRGGEFRTNLRVTTNVTNCHRQGDQYYDGAAPDVASTFETNSDGGGLNVKGTLAVRAGNGFRIYNDDETEWGTFTFADSHAALGWPMTLYSAATGARVAAATVGAGAQMYDTTLGKPIWSDGTNWKDAAGNVV